MSNLYRKGAVLPVIIGLIFLLVGLGVMWFLGFKAAGRTMEVRGWKPVECTVTKAELRVKADTAIVIETDVEYTYLGSGGKQIRGTQLEDAKGLHDTPKANELEEKLAELRSNPKLTGLVNPNNDGEAVLVKPAYWVPAASIAGGGIFALVGIAVMLRPKIKGGGTAIATLVAPLAVIGFAVAGGVCLRMGLKDDSKAVAARMVEAPCTILVSRVETKTSSSGSNNNHRKTTYRPEVLFSYQWQGRTWHSQWPDFAKNSYSSSSRSDSEDIVRRHPRGAAQTCWVDPNQPWVAVLEKTSRGSWLLWVLGIVFSVIGFGGLLGIVVMLFRKFLRPSAGGNPTPPPLPPDLPPA